MPPAESIAVPPKILVRGRPVAALSDALLALTIVDTIDGLYRCEASFTNWGTAGRTPDFLFFDARVLDFGMAFRVDTDRPLFKGRVMALEAHYAEHGTPTLTVLAEDRLQDLRMTRRTRTFTDVTSGDVLRMIAAEHGLTAQIDVTDSRHAVLAQVNQSDLAFLRGLARAVDADVGLDDTTLHVVGRGRRESVARFDYPTTLFECVASADLAHQRTSVEVTGWSGAKSPLRYEATESVLADAADGGTSGPKVLAAALGLRKEIVVHTVPQSADDVRIRAESLFKAMAHRFVVVQGTVGASSGLRVGTFVDLGGLGARLSGRYYVTEVRHTFDGTRGFRSEFTAESASLARSAEPGVRTPVRRAGTARPRSKTATPAAATRRSVSRRPSAPQGTSRRR